MNKLLRLLGISAVALAVIAGCKEYRTEYSEVKHENAIVTSKDPGGNFIGFGASIGNPGLGMLMSDHKEITFDGDIDFRVDLKNINRQGLYDIFNVGDLADVTYRNRFLSAYNGLNKDGQKELIEKRFIEHEFIDAQPIKN